MGKIRKVPFRRRREGKTNYRKRLALLKSGKPRLVFRKSNRHCIVQVVKYACKGDVSVVYITTKKLTEYGWLGKANIPSAYLCGYLAGKLALKKGIKEAVLDIGLIAPIKGSLPFAALKGALDAGMQIPHSPEILPSEERIKGMHIEKYASSLSEEECKKRFSEYFKNKIDPRKLSEHFEKVKKAIDSKLR